MTRRSLLSLLPAAITAQSQTAVTRYCRFSKGALTAHGILDGDTVRQLRGDLFANPSETGARHKLADVKLLYPIERPSKILALAGNYRSHLGSTPPRPNPEPFYKPPSSLQNPGDPILIPPGAKDVHYEAELVLVIGKTASRISPAQAKDHIFGVTCGNDVSERIWQNDPKIKDVQWWRAKGADTFSPVGPVIARGIDYHNLRIRARLNGQTVQDDHTSHFVHDAHITVSFISQAVTLFPGDLIFTGTSGQTKPMKPGDIIEIDIEGVGILSNPVKAT